MCKNARNRCSVLVAMNHADANRAIRDYARLINGRERKKALAVHEVPPQMD